MLIVPPVTSNKISFHHLNFHFTTSCAFLGYRQASYGLNRCMDKGLHGFKRYVGLSVLAYNLHVPGNALKARATIRRGKEKKTRLKITA